MESTIRRRSSSDCSSTFLAGPSSTEDCEFIRLKASTNWLPKVSCRSEAMRLRSSWTSLEGWELERTLALRPR